LTITLAIETVLKTEEGRASAVERSTLNRWERRRDDRPPLKRATSLEAVDP